MINAFVLFSNFDSTGYSGACTITGLPVTAKDTTSATFIGSAHQVTVLTSANDSIMPLVQNNSTTMNFCENGSTTQLNWASVGTGRTLRVAIQYIAA